MQGRDARSRRGNCDKPAKGNNPDRKSQVLHAQGQQPRPVKIGTLTKSEQRNEMLIK